MRAAWLLKLDQKGKVIWERSYGGRSDELYAIAALKNGGIAAVGGSWRKGKASDVWAFTVDPDGTLPSAGKM